MRRLSFSVIALLCAITAAAPTAQQPAPPAGQPPGAGARPGRGRGTPTAPPPIVWRSPPLPDGPMLYETGLVRPIRITATRGLNQPWSMAFLPDGRILVTERPGRLRVIRDGVLDPTPVAGMPAVAAQGLAGLMDIALHPRFVENGLLYFTDAGRAAAGSRHTGRQGAAIEG